MSALQRTSEPRRTRSPSLFRHETWLASPTAGDSKRARDRIPRTAPWWWNARPLQPFVAGPITIFSTSSCSVASAEFALAIYALPLFVWPDCGDFSYHTGTSLLGAIGVGSTAWARVGPYRAHSQL